MTPLQTALLIINILTLIIAFATVRMNMRTRALTRQTEERRNQFNRERGLDEIPLTHKPPRWGIKISPDRRTGEHEGHY